MSFHTLRARSETLVGKKSRKRGPGKGFFANGPPKKIARRDCLSPSVCVVLMKASFTAPFANSQVQTYKVCETDAADTLSQGCAPATAECGRQPLKAVARDGAARNNFVVSTARAQNAEPKPGMCPAQSAPLLPCKLSTAAWTQFLVPPSCFAECGRIQIRSCPGFARSTSRQKS